MPAARPAVNWRRMLWVAVFAALLFNWGCWDRWTRCDPMRLESCE